MRENRDLATDIVEIARVRYQNGGSSQQDVLAQVAVSELDHKASWTSAGGSPRRRAELARQLHVSPEADLQAVPEPPTRDVPARVERLYRVAAAVRPDLQGRLAAVARDEREVELARKRYYPNVQLGVGYMLMTRRDAMDPLADGSDNVGFTVGFNLPIYRKKLDAAVCEAQARALADARQYDFDRDQTFGEIKELHAEALALRETIDLLKDSILPKSEQAARSPPGTTPPGRSTS